MTLEELLADLPRECNAGSKKNSKGYVETWVGYKLHLDVADGQIPISCILTSASLHDSQAAIPLAQPPKDSPHGEIAAGQSPEGRALKFVHRGSYEAMDDTYEAITNYLDERRMEAKDLFIEQYVTDPLSTDEDHLIVNVLVLVK